MRAVEWTSVATIHDGVWSRPGRAFIRDGISIAAQGLRGDVGDRCDGRQCLSFGVLYREDHRAWAVFDAVLSLTGFLGSPEIGVPDDQTGFRRRDDHAGSGFKLVAKHMWVCRRLGGFERIRQIVRQFPGVTGAPRI